MEKRIDEQIIEEALRQKEVSALKTKGKLLEIGSKIILTLQANTDPYSEISSQGYQLVDIFIGDYIKTAEEYEKHIKAHKQITNNKKYINYLNKRIEDYNYMVEDADKYIKEKFALKELEKEK